MMSPCTLFAVLVFTTLVVAAPLFDMAVPRADFRAATQTRALASSAATVTPVFRDRVPLNESAVHSLAQGVDPSACDDGVAGCVKKRRALQGSAENTAHGQMVAPHQLPGSLEWYMCIAIYAGSLLALGPKAPWNWFSSSRGSILGSVG
ncbi:hypothetical protein C8R47DRAFT_1327838 [Mycena vitilis]|nr:hypothetical protein C8R47DRAFT_1327838 [Mycena vitilis]